jgi:predicted NBD/HSP70 family sugar kinase/cellobiose-specific phosphotransferase system component IIB
MPQSFDFRSWIRKQSGDYILDASASDHFLLKTSYAVAEINFYETDEYEIAEFLIHSKKDDEVKFFLHFETDEEEHAKSLFHEMVDVLVSLESQHSTKILLCCSTGLTTSYFAQRLNETAATMHLDYQFEARGVNTAYTEGFQYDAILLAPQIGFLLEKVQGVLFDKVVLQIPAAIFGKYDTGACMEMIRAALSEKKKTNEERALEHITHDITNDKVIMIIAVMPNASGTWIRYRVYDHGRITADREVIKMTLTIHDLTDIIDTRSYILAPGKEIDAIGIAVPGMIDHGRLELISGGMMPKTYDLQNGEGDDFRIVQYFSERYHLPVFVDNNVNAAAIGYYGQQDQYKNIVFHSQPRGYKVGGQGIVINGSLVEGAHSNAGEIRFVIGHTDAVQGLDYLVQTPEEMVKAVGAGIAMACSIVDPEIVCIRSSMTPDLAEIREELKKYLPDGHIPQLVKILNMDEYVLLGEMILVLQGIKKMKQ